jgi:hypothetical protein
MGCYLDIVLNLSTAGRTKWLAIGGLAVFKIWPEEARSSSDTQGSIAVETDPDS